MGDNKQNEKRSKVKEITIELPVNDTLEKRATRESVPRRVREEKEYHESDESFFGELNTMVKSVFSKEKADSLKETIKIGTDVVKNYKDDLKKKDNAQPFVPNRVEVKNKKPIDSGIEIEFGDTKEKPLTGREIFLNDIKKDTKAENKKAVKEVEIPTKTQTASVKEKTRENSASRKNTTSTRPRATSNNRKKPSNSFSAKATALIDVFAGGSSKKNVMSDKDFQKFVAIAITMLVIFGSVWYGFKYIVTDNMTEVSTVSKSEYPGLIKPSTLLVERVPNILEILGEPKESGSIDGTANKFIEYSGKWFGENAITKIVYGPDNRVYFADIDYENATVEKVYTNMVTYLGEPTTNLLEEEANEANWFVDSTLYILSQTNGVATLSIQTPLYNNSNNYPIAAGAIIVEKQGGYDLTGDGVKDVAVLIGEKDSYFFKEYTKFYLTVWDGENVFYTAFPTETNGGSNPKIAFEDVNGDSVIDIVVEAKNNAINNYNAFTAKTGSISVIYSNHEKK